LRLSCAGINFMFVLSLKKLKKVEILISLILHRLLLHPILDGEGYFPLCNFLSKVVEQKYLAGIVSLTLSFFFFFL